LMEATLVQTGAVPTPMGYGIVAFREPTAASRFVAERGGRITPLEELMRAGPRLSRLTTNPHSPEDHR
jgi:hypothetical protein